MITVISTRQDLHTEADVRGFQRQYNKFFDSILSSVVETNPCVEISMAVLPVITPTQINYVLTHVQRNTAIVIVNVLLTRYTAITFYEVLGANIQINLMHVVTLGRAKSIRSRVQCNNSLRSALSHGSDKFRIILNMLPFPPLRGLSNHR